MKRNSKERSRKVNRSRRVSRNVRRSRSRKG